MSSGTDAGVAGMTNRRQRILDFYVISKLLAVDTEVDPPQQNNPTPTESRDRPARYQSRGISIDRPWVLTAQLLPHRSMPERIHD